VNKSGTLIFSAKKLFAVCASTVTDGADLYRLVCLDPALFMELQNLYCYFYPEAKKLHGYVDAAKIIISLNVKTVKSALLDFAGREVSFFKNISKTEEEKQKKIMQRSVAVAIASRFLAKENGVAPEKFASYYAAGLMYGANMDDAASDKPAAGKEGLAMEAHLSFAADIATLAGFPPLGKKRKPSNNAAASVNSQRTSEKIIKIVKKEIKNAEKFLREKVHA
jgi:hypothetical protein